MRDAGLKLGLAVASTILALTLSLVVGEVVLRVATPDAYRVWTPHRRMTFRLPPGRAPGIRSPTKFTINGDGIRGDAITAGQAYRILAVGGSTTECLLLDDSLAWPHLLQDALNQNRAAGGGDEGTVWVGNVGRSGLRAVHHTLHLKNLLPEYPRMDAVIVMVGINDFQNWLGRAGSPGSSAVDTAQLLQHAFDELPRRYRPGPIYKRTEIWHRLRLLKSHGRQGAHAQDDNGNNLVTWRRHRQSAAYLRTTLPQLDSALAAYRRDLDETLNEARRFGARIILVTQPTLWRAGLPPALLDLLWLGGVGDFQAEAGHEYYSVEALARGLDRYNETLLDVCRSRGGECVDAAAVMPRDTTVFYDDVHLNEAGSRRLARLLADYLRTTTPPRLASYYPTTRSAP